MEREVYKNMKEKDEKKYQEKMDETFKEMYGKVNEF